MRQVIIGNKLFLTIALPINVVFLQVSHYCGNYSSFNNRKFLWLGFCGLVKFRFSMFQKKVTKGKSYFFWNAYFSIQKNALKLVQKDKHICKAKVCPLSLTDSKIDIRTGARIFFYFFVPYLWADTKTILAHFQVEKYY